MMQVGTNQSATYHSQPALSTTGGQAGRSSSNSRQQPQQSQYDTDQLANIRPRLCVLRKWPHYDGYGVHLARNQHWLGLRIGDVEPNSPAESGGLLREDVVLAVNGHSVENDDFFVILSFIQHELEGDQIRFLVLDPHSADLARRQNLNIDENYRGCVRMETPTLTVSPEKLLYDQWRTTNASDPAAAQTTINLGPTLSLNQDQAPTNAPRYREASPRAGRDDVYTFLPYSDHALENGKTFFEILFEQSPQSATQSESTPRRTTDDSSNQARTGDNDNSKDKHHGSHIKDGIKNLAKTGIENIKSIIPTSSQSEKDKSDKNDSKRGNDSGPVDRSTNRAESPSLVDKIKDKLKRSPSPTKTAGKEKQSESYDRLWQSSSPSQSAQDTNNNLGLGPRMCSVTLRPGDSIGISLQQDKDFSHIIKHVEPNSAADYAGIERDDCIISLNDIPLLHVSYQEVLNTLKRYRNDPNLDFLVAKKSYLLKSNQNNTAAEVLPSSNIPSTVPPTQALEQLFNKYNNEQKSPYDQTSSSNQARETVSTSTPNDRLSPQFDNDRYPSKSQQGQILHGVGPATADQSSWGVSSGKSSDEFPLSGDSSIRSTSRDRRPDADESKGRNSSLDGSLKPLQVGITNPAASQQSANTTPNLNNSPQRTSRPTSSDEQRERSPSPNANRGSSRTNETLQHIPAAVPITPGQPSSTKRDYEQGSTQPVPSNQADIQLATTPISQLKEQGYELHNIQLMQPTETSPVGLKLTKQQEPLQYIITAVAKGTKADLAGLRVDDWLIKIDDKDIRLTEFSEVSHEIRQLLTNAGLINLVIARKKSPTSSPAIKQVETQRSPAVSSSSPQTDSFTRQQKSQNAQSLLTTDITRDTPDNNQVRFTADQSQNTTAVRSQRSPAPSRENISNTPGAPLSVGITNPISDENATRSPRSRSTSPSRSPTREFPLNREQKASLTEQPSDVIDPNEIRQIVLKEALGLDFNSFIPEGDSNTQTHFISNVQASSMADKAGLRDGDRILTVNGVDVRNAVHEDVRQMMQSKKPLQLTVVNDPKYLELIESVKRNLPKSEEPASRNRTSPKKSSDETANSSSNIRSKDDLSKNLSTLFTDDKGAVQVKHCLLKKEPNYNGYGLLLRYQNGLHLIDQVEQDSPAYNAGLREDDVILFVDQKNVEQMTHDDVKILIRKLSLSNTNIDLILIRKSDMQRYNTYQQKNTLNWAGIFDHELPAEPRKTDQQQTNNPRPINDPVTVPRQGSTSSSKQPAPAPPSAASEESTRTCILIPSPERTAGFALSGTAPPPYVICQIEKGSPAEKAGLLLNDTLLSINGKSVVDSEYKDTVKLIKEALQQKSVELVVREQSTNKSRAKTNSQSSMPDPRNNSSLGSYDSNNAGNTGSVGPESSTRGANAVEEYQKQRNKELSYSLRLCHLHPTNGDGTQASTFGFELSEEPDYEYPLILRVEPHSSAEGAGLQSRDILLKINDKKTKGLGYEKVKKEIEKAKRDGRLEMLVVDQETFDYCKRTKKPMKEPEMKVKHVFPKSRSSASFHKLPLLQATTTASSLSSRDSLEQLNNSMTKHDENSASHQRLPVGFGLTTSRETDSENEDEERSNPREGNAPTKTVPAVPPVKFDLITPTSSVNTPIQHQNHPQSSPLKFFDPAQTSTQRSSITSTGSQNGANLSRSATSLNQNSSKDSKGSKAKAIPHAINNLFHKIGHSKSSKRS